MRASLAAFAYGNRDLSGGLTTFWIDGSLRISADEQVEFMRRFATGALPISPRHVAAVRESIRYRQSERGTLFGKTGSARATAASPALGWFVGFVEGADGLFAFALNLQGAGDSGAVARERAVAILTSAVHA